MCGSLFVICMKNRSLPRCVRAWGPLLALAFAARANGATLKSETALAWNKYLQSSNETLQSRVAPGGNFLWTLEDEKRATKVRAGEIVIEPAPGQVPKRVSGGLIHHWMGAAFLSNVTLDDVLAVTGNYERYKDIYSPSVRVSQLLSSNGSQDAIRLVFLNKTMFMKSAVDANYEITNVHIDKSRFYSTSNATRIQEVADYGHPNEHLLPEGQGDGFVWKIFAITRLEQRDGGVYFELEGIELSRGIPAMLRFIVEPMVRSVSRRLMLESVRQTREAVAKRGDTNTVISSEGTGPKK